MNKRSDTSGKQPTIEIQATWRPGTRTPAWNDLWRQIMADLGDVLDQPFTDDVTEGSDRTGPPTTPNGSAGCCSRRPTRCSGRRGC